MMVWGKFLSLLDHIRVKLESNDKKTRYVQLSIFNWHNQSGIKPLLFSTILKHNPNPYLAMIPG